MDNNATVVTKPRRSRLLPACLIFLILLLATCGGLGYLGYRYRDQIRDFNLKTGNTTNNKSNTDTTTRTFTSDSVTQPGGSIVDLVSRTSPAVVTVINKSFSSSILEEDNDSSGAIGTGFFVSTDGLLITNEHVVCGSSNTVNLSVVTSENKTYSVDSMAVDSVQDIAILKVNTKNEKVPTLKFANPDSQIKVGQEVIAIGNPLGVNPGSVTRGIISGVDRNLTAGGAACRRSEIGSRTTNIFKEYEGVIQTDAAINGGNSGGPLINLNGEVIGVNSATTVNANNISYSIPFQRVLKILDRYQKNNGRLTFPYIGVEHSMIDTNRAKAQDVPAGALVRSVVASSPAEKAGIRRGDIITKIDDKRLEFSLQATLSQFFEPNQKVKVEVYRLNNDAASTGNYITLDLTIGEKSS